MDKQLLDKFPTWYKDLNPEKHYMVMSNDFDSFYSCQLITKTYQLEVGGFYSFESGLYLNKEITEGKEPIFVDLSIVNGKTFDNHYTFIENLQAINPNVNTSVYYKKYNGSTLSVLYSLFDIDLSKLKETSLTALLCIDSWYYGYYNKGGQYKDINIYWYKKLNMDKYLLPILESHDNQYFKDFIKDWKLDKEIYIIDGYLKVSVNVPLPTYKFELVQSVQKEFMSKDNVQTLYKNNPTQIITSAETFKDSYVINRKK